MYALCSWWFIKNEVSLSILPFFEKIETKKQSKSLHILDPESFAI